MAPSRFRSGRIRNATLAVAVAASLHFLVSSFIWGTVIYVAARGPWPERPIPWEAVPAFLLLVGFGSATLAAILRQRVAGWLLVVGLLCAAGLFAYDRAYRDHVWRAENYSEGWSTYRYPTWWWYDWR